MEGRPLDDTESGLVERVRRGDVRAYEEIVRRYQDIAFRLAYTILGSAEEAEDAAQEGFVRAYHALDRFRQGAPLRPWLLTIVANAARTRRATAARRPALTLQAAATASDDSAQSPEAVALIAEQRRELLGAVNALRIDDQRVIAYRYYLDL
ncbi:MAG: polymerase, partial [Thermomicrobiales bacterium]|nr:polymerase [Thermomicrobiales bacterium]